MFKKIKESGVITKYKDLRSNPQTKAIISLGFWLLFFFVIILFTRSTTRVSSNLSKKENIYSYEFTYSNDVNVIFGKSYNDEKLYTILNQKYYYKDNIIYNVDGHNLTENSNVGLGVLRIDLKMIDSLISNINEMDNGEYKRYLVPLSRFLNLFEDASGDLTNASSYNIIIDRYYKDSDIYMVKIDLSSYYSFRDLNNDGILTIDLYNVNKTSDLKEYFSMLGGV